ncbi:MAG TPA: GNAT family N-acetyltransferase [Thermoanaerobaculia bacterium]|nr:GNAT family N-acetyltransferase [Thermoanaerobaculia bacterium]
MHLVTNVESLESISSEWEALWRRAPGATPFQSPHWLLPWWSHFANGGELAFVMSADACAPLYVLRDADESLGMFLGTGISDYLDFIGTEVEPLLACALEADCMFWDLQQVRPSSPLLSAALPEGWSDNAEEMDPCPVLSIENAGEELSNLLSTHARKKLRYFRRCLAREAVVTYESVTPATLDSFLTALFELHAARWQTRGLPGVLADDVVQSFHREVAPRMLAAGALRMHAIRMNERIVAVFYGFAHQGTVYYYLSGFDPALERLSIGNIIVAHAVEEAVREGATTFDFLRGAEEYKYAWGATDRVNRRRQLFRG